MPICCLLSVVRTIISAPPVTNSFISLSYRATSNIVVLKQASITFADPCVELIIKYSNMSLLDIADVNHNIVMGDLVRMFCRALASHGYGVIE
jgi:hypothetical protein